VWKPIKLSRITSRHQRNIIVTRGRRVRMRIEEDSLYWNHKTIVNVRQKTEKERNKGQRLPAKAKNGVLRLCANIIRRRIEVG
jgi:hypothetical protein